MMLIKIGGGEDINLEAVITDLAQSGQPFIIVHGANVLRDRLAQRLGMEKTVLTSISGYASVFSDQDALDVGRQCRIGCDPENTDLDTVEFDQSACDKVF